MKKRIFLSYLLILAMIATLMTACGKKEEAPEPLTEAVEATEVVEATEELETETVAEKTTELSGLDNGISITGELGTAADATIESVEDDTESEIKDLVSEDLGKDVSATESYDITIVDENGNAMQPEGTVTITIPISDEIAAAEGDTYAVYYYNPEDSMVENIECKTTDNAIVFDTTHFSVYSIVKYTNEPATEEISETEPAETPETKESVSTENTNSEPAAVATADLPGINRNGRYPDIPESVLPADKAANMDFFDEPVKATCWIDDVEGKIYADYGMTQLIKSVRYSVDGYNDVLYIIAEDGTDSEARGIATYNGQYVVINFNMWGLWFNDLDPNYN